MRNHMVAQHCTVSWGSHAVWEEKRVRSEVCPPAVLSVDLWLTWCFKVYNCVSYTICFCCVNISSRLYVLFTEVSLPYSAFVLYWWMKRWTCFICCDLLFSLVAGVRFSQYNHLPVGAGHHSASLLPSSRSLSFTTRSWNNKANHWFSSSPYLCLNVIPWAFSFFNPTSYYNSIFVATISRSSPKELDLKGPVNQNVHIRPILKACFISNCVFYYYTVPHGIYDLAHVEDFTLKNLCSFLWSL